MLKSIFGHRASYLDIKTIDKVQSLCRSIENQINQNELQEKLLHLLRHIANKTMQQTSRDILRQHWNFSLTKDQSSTHDQGVFLDYGRIREAGQIVAIYPGTVYRRSLDPLLLPSIRNQFLLARKDDLVIDGRDRGLSRSIYLSCYFRYPRYDKTWLSQNIDEHRNPLALGHYINHFPNTMLPNVTYYEFDFDFAQTDVDLYSFVPHVRYADMDDDDTTMPSTVLISLRPIEKGEELFSCYLNLIKQEKLPSFD